MFSVPNRNKTAFTVPKKKKKLVVGGKKKKEEEERRKGQSVDPCYHKGCG